MIVVKVELWPANATRAKEIARLSIWNAEGRYFARVVNNEGDQQHVREGEVIGYGGGSVWWLLEKALECLEIGRSIEQQRFRVLRNRVEGLANAWAQYGQFATALREVLREVA